MPSLRALHFDFTILLSSLLRSDLPTTHTYNQSIMRCCKCWSQLSTNAMHSSSCTSRPLDVSNSSSKKMGQHVQNRSQRWVRRCLLFGELEARVWEADGEPGMLGKVTAIRVNRCAWYIYTAEIRSTRLFTISTRVFKIMCILDSACLKI